MLSTVFAEHFGLKPRYAHAIQIGGGTGAAMLMLGDLLVRGGEARNLLVVGGDNRLTGMSRDAAVQAELSAYAPAVQGWLQAKLGSG